MRTSARPTIASATPASASAAGAGGFDPSVFTGLRRHPRRPRRHLRLRRPVRRRPAPRRAAARRRPPLRPRDHVRGIRDGHGNRRSRFRGRRTATTCSGTGAAPGSSPTVCNHCRGQGQVRSQQGFFTVARTCPQCRGDGKDDQQAVHDVPRRRTRDARAQDHGQDSGRHRDRPAASPAGRGRSRDRQAARPAASTSSSTCRSTSSSDATA